MKAERLGQGENFIYLDDMELPCHNLLVSQNMMQVMQEHCLLLMVSKLHIVWIVSADCLFISDILSPVLLPNPFRMGSMTQNFS